jgi:hypothetical protein
VIPDQVSNFAALSKGDTMNRPEFFLTFVLTTGAACFLIYCAFTAASFVNATWLNGLFAQGAASFARLGALSVMVGIFVAACRTGLRD